ncbi:ISL3 family transposase [Gordonia amicalis]|nr:ISL3 family transposase [Gordonia amicalis]UPW16331.1 ISL3 family transposase [Gordonia amicalis]
MRAHRAQSSRCPHCRRRRPGYDRGTQPRRWRHLDLGGTRCYLQGYVHRVDCAHHGVVTEHVPWARPAAKMTRAFDDTVAWLAAHSPASAVCEYMRVSWRTVQRIIARVVADHTGRTDRLNGLRRIGIDEIAYRKGRRYMTVIIDHDTGRLVWAREGATKKTLRQFFDELGVTRSAELTHVSADAGQYIETVVAERVPDAIRCMDPFHVVQWATRAVDRCRSRVLHRVRGLSNTDRRHLRWALLKNPENLTPAQQRTCELVVKRANSELARAYQLKEELRHIVTGTHSGAWRRLELWLHRAEHSRIIEFVGLSKSVRQQQVQIYNSVVVGLSNARAEATNTHLRALTKRAYGFHSPEALTAMATLTRGGACPVLPHQ